MDRQAALIGFSESPENVALVGSAIANGIWLGWELVYRAGTLNNFAISAENIANVADQIVDGIQYQAYVG